MIGVAKVFVKDLYEMSSRPYLGIWLILVPLALLYVAGQSIVNSPQTLLLLNERVESDVDVAEIAELLEEFSELRIERDDWVSQAKILAEGGETEFSERVAKGEVPSSAGGKKKKR